MTHYDNKPPFERVETIEQAAANQRFLQRHQFVQQLLALQVQARLIDWKDQQLVGVQDAAVETLNLSDYFKEILYGAGSTSSL